MTTKTSVRTFLQSKFPNVIVAYSGREGKFYLTGTGKNPMSEAEKAELAVIKQFPGITTQSQSAVPAHAPKPYFFNSAGDFTNDATELKGQQIFDCIARDNRNARRKFGNHIASLSRLNAKL